LRVRIHAILAALAIALLAGCTSGSMRIPENLPRSGAAVVRAWSPGDVRVEEIDGVEIGKVTHVYVAAGEHQITVRWTGGQNVTRIGQVRGRLAAGSTYSVEAEPDAALRTVLFTLVDKGPNYDEQCLQRPTFGGDPKGRGC
jgi:outer membrane biogenesis lipoprotein LolB